MSNSRYRCIAGAMVLAALAFGCLSYYYSNEPFATTVASSGTKKQRPTAKSVETSEPAPEPIPANRPRKPIDAEIAKVPKEILNLMLSTEARVEREKNRAQLRVDREIQSLKRAATTLRPDQEQRIREALELNMPKITEKNGTLVTTIRGPEPSLENHGMKKAFETLDPDQQQAVEGIIRKAAKDTR